MSQMVRIAYRGRTAIAETRTTLVPLAQISSVVAELNRDRLDVTGIELNAREEVPMPQIVGSTPVDDTRRVYTVEYKGQRHELVFTRCMSAYFTAIPGRSGITAVEGNTIIALVQGDAQGRMDNGTFGRLQ